MSGWRSKNCFKGSAEGWLREVAHEFGGQIPHGGRNRASDSVGTRWVIDVVLFFVVARCVQVTIVEIIVLILHHNTQPQHNTTKNKNTDTMISPACQLPAAPITKVSAIAVCHTINLDLQIRQCNFKCETNEFFILFTIIL
jgi:hypothetical protein